MADLEMVTTRIESSGKRGAQADKTQARDKAELELQLRLQEAIEAEKPIRSAITEDDMELVRALNFLTLKPMMAVVNVGEDRIGETIDLPGAEGMETITLSAEIESELAKLDPESRAEFMKDMGITESAASRFVQSCYATLGLISFLTVGRMRCGRGPLRKHDGAERRGRSTAISAGFIGRRRWRMRTCASWETKSRQGGGQDAAGGKTYVVQDGDIITSASMCSAG